MLKNENTIVKKQLKLMDAIFYKKLLDYIPEYWDFENTLNKKAKDLSVLELKRILMLKKYYNTQLLLSHAINKMEDENLDYIMVDSNVYNEIMNFQLDEIINMKFKNNTEYINYMINEKCYIPNNNVLNKDVSLYNSDSIDIKHKIKGKTTFKKYFHNPKKY